MAWMNMQQVWTQQPQSAPHGWAGSWPPIAPAGYPGPPPLPAGMNVNPQQWVSGQWMINPMYRGPVPGSQGSFPMWAAHPSWAPPVAHASAAAAAAAANYNPYKRVPNPGNANYWNTKLLENPLGLEGMDIRDDTPQEQRHVKDSPNGVPHTPWVWVPRELGKPEGDKSSDQRNGQGAPAVPVLPAQPHHSQDVSQSSRAQDQQTRSHTHDGSTHTLSHTHEPTHAHTQERSASQPQPYPRQSHKGSSPGYPPESERHANSGGPPGAPSSVSASQQGGVIPPPPDRLPPGSDAVYASYQQQQQQRQQRSRDVSPRHPEQAHETRTSPRPPSSSASAAAAAAAAAASAPVSSTSASSSAPKPQPQAQPEAFSAKLELHPTFSPSVVRTPDYYSSVASTPPSRRTSYDDVDHTPSRQPVSQRTYGPIYGPPTPSRANSSTTTRQSTASTSSASSTATSSTPISSPSSITSPASFCEEPLGLLSPLVGMPTPCTASRLSPSGRELSRSQTYPLINGSSPFDAIPEDRAAQLHTPQRTPRTPHTPRPPERERERERERNLDPNTTPLVQPRTPTYATPEAGSRHLGRSQTFPSLDLSPQPSPPHVSSRSRATSPPGHTRHISRSQTYPSLDPSPQPSPTRPNSRSRGPSPPGHTRQVSGTPKYSSLSPSPQPSPTRMNSRSRGLSPSGHPRQVYRSQTFPSLDLSPQPSPTHARSRSRGPSPREPAGTMSTAIYSSNPIPTPPRPSTYVPPASYSASMQAHSAHVTSASMAANASHAHNRQQVRTERRLGYWNRRGDYLIVEKDKQFIVYAPRSLANPYDLAQYPTPTEGFMDQFGNKIKYDPKVPELPESLPLHGEPPRRPYQDFVHYVSVWET